MAKRGANASFSYFGQQGVNSPDGMDLWVEEVSQTFGMSGSTHQSRHRSTFYPKNNQVGPLNIKIRLESTQELARLARFIRAHHKLLASWYGSISPGPSLGPGPDGKRYLLHFVCPSENINVYGWVETFVVDNRGLFVPAPEVTLPFVVALDSRSVTENLTGDLVDWLFFTRQPQIVPDLPTAEQIRKKLERFAEDPVIGPALPAL